MYPWKTKTVYMAHAHKYISYSHWTYTLQQDGYYKRLGSWEKDIPTHTHTHRMGRDWYINEKQNKIKNHEINKCTTVVVNEISTHFKVIIVLLK